MNWKHIFARKDLEMLLAEMAGEHRLRRILGPVSLTALGIGCIIGAGIFVLTGVAAAEYGGPAIILSFAVAAVGCALAALCYAEFAAMAPVAGSVYAYAYTTLGEIFAWIIGWDLILEYSMGTATVASSWSGYLNELIASIGKFCSETPWGIPKQMLYDPWCEDGLAAHAWLNLPAVVIMALVTSVLVIGIREMHRTNAVLVLIKLTVVLFVIAIGIGYVAPKNWTEIAVEQRVLPRPARRDQVGEGGACRHAGPRQARRGGVRAAFRSLARENCRPLKGGNRRLSARVGWGRRGAAGKGRPPFARGGAGAHRRGGGGRAAGLGQNVGRPDDRGRSAPADRRQGPGIVGLVGVVGVRPLARADRRRHPVPVYALRALGDHARGVDCLFRLHRLRFDLHPRRRGPATAARRAHRHHHVAGGLHGALHGRRHRNHGHGPLPRHRRACADCGGLRAAGGPDPQPPAARLDGAHFRRRTGGNHQRAVGAVPQPGPRVHGDGPGRTAAEDLWRYPSAVPHAARSHAVPPARSSAWWPRWRRFRSWPRWSTSARCWLSSWSARR